MPNAGYQVLILPFTALPMSNVYILPLAALPVQSAKADVECDDRTLTLDEGALPADDGRRRRDDLGHCNGLAEVLRGEWGRRLCSHYLYCTSFLWDPGWVRFEREGEYFWE